MKTAIEVEKAAVGSSKVLIGRPSSTRQEWESARSQDAKDLNWILEHGGTVELYIAPLWSNGDAERCLAELRGFDEARVYAEVVPGNDLEQALATIAESEWAGAAMRGGDSGHVATFIHIGAGLEISMALIGVDEEKAYRAVALAIGEDFSAREIAKVLRGDLKDRPDDESVDHAHELLEVLSI